MRIYVDIFKASGKWYTRMILDHKEDLSLGSDEFMAFLKENVLCKPEGGFIVTSDDEKNTGFHAALYRSEEL